MNGQPVIIGGSKEIQDSMHNPLEILVFWQDEGMTAKKKHEAAVVIVIFI